MGVLPPALSSLLPIYAYLGGDRQSVLPKNTTQCRRPGLEGLKPGPLDLQRSVLSMRPPRRPNPMLLKSGTVIQVFDPQVWLVTKASDLSVHDYVKEGATFTENLFTFIYRL